MLALVITAVTEFYVDKKAEALVDDDHIDQDELQLDETNQPDDAHLTDDDDLSLTPLERKGLAWAGVTLAVTLAAFFALLLIPASPFARPDEGFMESPLIQAIAIPISLIFLATGLVYGLVVGTINESADIPKFMAKGLESLLPILVLFFAVSQFLAWFQWSNLGPWTAIKGSELLQSWDLPNMVLFAAFALMVTTINLFITSGSAQWALMAPVVVPMMMYVGVSPEVTQMLYRIGDSPSNIITPMSPYFALALTFLQKYYKKAGVGTLMSLSLPYAVSMLIGWFIFFMIWHFLGIPLGPGSPMGYEV